jgi:hypothetical protein
MYLLTKSRRLRLAPHESLAAILTLFVAETFYRFHSFTVKCLAFLAAWYAVSWTLNEAQKFGRQTNALLQIRLLRTHGQAEPDEAHPAEIGGVRNG